MSSILPATSADPVAADQMPAEPTGGMTATAREALYYVEAGMTPLETLRAATIEPARMQDAEADIGSLDIGKYADIVALASDPTGGIGALQTIHLVMKGEIVYLNVRP